MARNVGGHVTLIEADVRAVDVGSGEAIDNARMLRDYTARRVELGWSAALGRIHRGRGFMYAVMARVPPGVGPRWAADLPVLTRMQLHVSVTKGDGAAPWLLRVTAPRTAPVVSRLDELRTAAAAQIQDMPDVRSGDGAVFYRITTIRPLQAPTDGQARRP